MYKSCNKNADCPNTYNISGCCRLILNSSRDKDSKLTKPVITNWWPEGHIWPSKASYPALGILINSVNTRTHVSHPWMENHQGHPSDMLSFYFHSSI